MDDEHESETAEAVAHRVVAFVRNGGSAEYRAPKIAEMLAHHPHVQSAHADPAGPSGMTLTDAAFEMAAAWYEMEELTLRDENTYTARAAVGLVKESLDVAQARNVIDEAAPDRDDGFEPFAAREDFEEYPEWRCEHCGNRPILLFDEAPPIDCSYCGGQSWVTEEQYWQDPYPDVYECPVCGSQIEVADFQHRTHSAYETSSVRCQCQPDDGVPMERVN